jgi:hypothetical protein
MSRVSDQPPTASVIIPTYNQARLVTRAVDSVLAQSFTDYEIIVVDDGSTDDTRAVLARYGQGLTYFYQENRERSAARNLGLRRASGKYVMFLDADDVLLPNMLSVQAEYLERHPRAALVHGYALMADARGRVLRPPVLMGAPLDPGQHPFGSLVMGTPILIHTTLIRRECLDVVGGFDEALSVSEDWDLWLRLAARYDVGFSHQPVAVYAMEVESYPAKLDRYRVQEHIPRMIEQAFRYLPEASPLMGLKSRAVARAHVQWGACLEHAMGRAAMARSHIQAALGVYPALDHDIEVLPKGAAWFATWCQDDGAAFIQSFFRDVPLPPKTAKQLERSALVLYHSKKSHLAAHQRRYGAAAGHVLRAAAADPVALGWAGRQFVRRLWHRAFGR